MEKKNTPGFGPENHAGRRGNRAEESGEGEVSLSCEGAPNRNLQKGEARLWKAKSMTVES
jgi:hypothetical protein